MATTTLLPGHRTMPVVLTDGIRAATAAFMFVALLLVFLVSMVSQPSYPSDTQPAPQANVAPVAPVRS